MMEQQKQMSNIIDSSKRKTSKHQIFKVMVKAILMKLFLIDSTTIIV